MTADNETVERRLDDTLAELAATTSFQDDAWDRITRRYSDNTEPDVLLAIQSADTDVDHREGDTIVLDTEDRRTGDQPRTPRRRSPNTWLMVAAAAVVVVVVGAVLVVAGGDDEHPVDTATSPTTPTTHSSDSTDQRVADEAVLVVSDLPEGWSAAPITEGGTDVENVIAECGATDPSSLVDDGDPRSAGDWQSVEGFAGSSVEINGDETQAEATLAALRTPAGQECLAEHLASGFTLPDEVGEFELIEQPSNGLGDDAITFRAAVPVSYEGDDFIWFSDLTTIRQGRALVFLALGQADEPMDAAEQQRLTETVLERLPSDL